MKAKIWSKLSKIAPQGQFKQNSALISWKSEPNDLSSEKLSILQEIHAKSLNILRLQGNGNLFYLQFEID